MKCLALRIICWLTALLLLLLTVSSLYTKEGYVRYVHIDVLYSVEEYDMYDIRYTVYIIPGYVRYSITVYTWHCIVFHQ